MAERRDPFPSQLLTNEPWLRAFVRRLVAADDVDDVVQSTWAAALRRREAPRPLLAGIARRLAAMLHRGEARRRQRERAVAAAETQPATDALVARLELMQQVAAAVCALPEPYRATLLRHYQLDASIAELAAADGIDAAAVRKRLQRGRELVRARLAGTLGPEWRAHPAVLLLLHCRPRRALPTAATVTAAAAAIMLLPVALTLAEPVEPAPTALAMPVDTDAVAAVRTPAAATMTSPPARVLLPLAQDPDKPAARGKWQLIATVRDAGGKPVRNAIVRLRSEDQWSSAAGICRFELAGPLDQLPDRISARLMPTTAPAPGPTVGPAVARRAAAPTPTRVALLPVVRDGLRAQFPTAGGKLRVELQFGDAALSISGRVLTEDGAPVARVTVFLAEAEPLDPESWPAHPLTPVEDLSTMMEGEVLTGELRCLTALLATTDADGSFTLTGLRPRDYVLRAYHWKSMSTVDSPLLAAGSKDVELRLPAPSRRQLRGVVRDRAGQPLADVKVVALLPMLRVGDVTDCAVAAETVTDSRGEFVCTAPAQAVELAVRSPDLLPLGVPIPAGRKPIELRTDRRHGLRIAVGKRAGTAATFEVLDAREQPLPLCAPPESPLPPQLRLPVRGGRADTAFTCGDAAIVQFRDAAGRVLLRMPCALRPDEVVELR